MRSGKIAEDQEWFRDDCVELKKLQNEHPVAKIRVDGVENAPIFGQSHFKFNIKHFNITKINNTE